VVVARNLQGFDSRRLHYYFRKKPSLIDIFHIVNYEIWVLLKPLDVVVSVKAAVLGSSGWTMASMATALGLDTAQVFRATRNAAAARLLVAEPGKGRVEYRAHRAALIELLVHGIKYMMVPVRGGMTRGLATAHAAPVMTKHIVAGTDPSPVWPTPEGTVRGEAFEPLHRCVPIAARADERFYAAMALVDAIRGGRARDRALAIKLLPEVLRADTE